MAFVHLRTHSRASIKDGLIPYNHAKKGPRSLSQLAADDGQVAIALTDLANMYGAIGFHEDALADGVKPILGVDAWVEPDVTQPDGLDGKPVHTRVVLLAQDEEGYRKIMHWLSRAFMENLQKGVPLIKQSWLAEGTEGVVALSGDMQHGEMAQAVLEDDQGQGQAKAKAALDFYKRAFGDRFYIELQRYGQKDEAVQVERLAELASANQVPPVATQPVQFATRDDFFVHELRYCVSNGEVISTPGRHPAFTPEQYFKSSEEMTALFADIPEAVSNTAAIAATCSVRPDIGQHYLPDFSSHEMGEMDMLRQRAAKGMEKRLEQAYPDAAERARHHKEWDDRLQYELGVIDKMGFAGYFLIVSDFIGYARDHDIMVGPGRGSGAGSLVAYSTGITDIDPMRYNLLFERFLNPERISMPDVDVDFEFAGRGDVIQYVIDHYGEDRVAQIATLGTLGGRAAINGVGRAFGISPRTIAAIAALVPQKPGMTLKLAVKGDPEKDIQPIPALVSRYETEAEVRKVIDAALKLEGSPTNVGVHASGLLISPRSVSDFSPLYYDPSSAGQARGRSHYDMNAVERAGLVKFDFLGLATLDIIKDTLRLINQRHPSDKPLVQSGIPLADPKTLDAIAAGDTVNVFQLESDGMQRMLKAAKPTCLEDVVAMVALFRPGPMDLIPSFCARKNGNEVVEYPDPRVEPILKETYGIMVYQEQVMQMAQILGGYSLGAADLLRRAMGKKKVEEMDKQRQIFREGAVRNGLTEAKADEIFALMEKFAGYGFNKSHAAAYGTLAYQTAWLKTNYPIEFYTATMNFEALEKKLVAMEKTISDARAHGFKILPPDINAPSLNFEPASGAIRYGMAGLKGVSVSSVEAIIAERERGGEFRDIFDFVERMPRKDAGKKVLDAMVCVGAFDSLYEDRASLMAAIPDLIKYAGKYATRKAKADSLLSEEDLPELGAAKRKTRRTKPVAALERPEIAKAPAWSQAEALEKEHAVAGFYMSGHPFQVWRQRLGGLAAATSLRDAAAIDPQDENGLRLIAGVVSAVFVNTKQDGKRWAKVILSDGTASSQIMIWSEGYEPAAGWLRAGEFMAAGVRIAPDRRDSSVSQMNVDQVFSFEQMQARLAKAVDIAVLPSELESVGKAIAACAPASQSEESIPVRLHMPDPKVEGRHLVSSSDRAPRIAAASLKTLTEAVGQDRVHIEARDSLHLQPSRRRRPYAR